MSFLLELKCYEGYKFQQVYTAFILFPIFFRSENLLNGIDRLIEQILATKSDSLSERIASEIDKHLGIDHVEELAPGTEPSVDKAIPVATTSSTISTSSEVKSTKALPPVKSVEASQSHSASPAPQGSALPASQMLPQATAKATVKVENEQNSKKHVNENPAKTQRSSLILNKGHVGTSQSPQVLTLEPSGSGRVQGLHNQNKKDIPVVQGGSSDISKPKANMDNNAKSQKLGKDLEGNKLKRDTEKSLAKNEKSTISTGTVNASSRTEELSHSEDRKTESDGNNAQPCSEMQPSSQTKAKNEQLSLPKTEKITRVPVNKNSSVVKSSTANLEECKKEKDCISGNKCDLASDVTNTSGTKQCDNKPCGMKNIEGSSVIGTAAVDSYCSGDTNQLKDEKFEDVGEKYHTPSNTIKSKQDGKLGAGEDLKVKPDVKFHDVVTVDNIQENKIKEVARDIESSIDVDLASIKTESVNTPKGNDSENGKESKVEKAVSDETSERKEMKDSKTIDDTCKDLYVSKVPVDDLYCRNSENTSQPKGLSLELTHSTDDDGRGELEDIEGDSNEGSLKNIQELETFVNSTDDASGIDSQLGLRQRRVKKRRRLISEDGEKQKMKASKVDENESTHDSKLETGIEEYKPKKARGRPRKSGGVKADSRHSSDNEIPPEESSAGGLSRTELGKTKYRSQEEPIETRGVKRQRSVGSESNASDTCVEDRDIESHRRTRRQIKPKRCYSPSDGK